MVKSCRSRVDIRLDKHVPSIASGARVFQVSFGKRPRQSRTSGASEIAPGVLRRLRLADDVLWIRSNSRQKQRWRLLPGVPIDGALTLHRAAETAPGLCHWE